MKLTRKMKRTIEVYVARGEAAGEEITALKNSIWVDYEWGFGCDEADSQTAICILDLFETKVLQETNKVKALKNAKRLIKLLK